MSVVEFVREDFVGRTKLEKETNAENMVREFRDWGYDE